MEHQLKRRMSDQRFTEWEILEEHTDIYEASDREIQLQKDYGLPVDKVPYWQTVENNSKGGWSENAWNAMKLANTGIKRNFSKTHQSKAGKNGGKSIANQIHTCPHCSAQIKGRVYHRWHGDNCKHKKTLTN